jgi:ATP-dependent RNA circularization protein (DNA/RNA ligase family)
LPENVILFGEWSGHHTIDYGANNDKFFLIDILNLDSQRFMKYEDSVKFVQDLNIPGVNVLPVLASGKVDKSTLDRFLQRTSDYYDGPKEGLVIKDYNPHPQKFVKILNKGFAEQRAKIFGRIDPFTEARIRKNILHALEEIDMNELTLERLYEFIQDDVRKETDRYYTLDYIRRRAEPNLRKMWELQGKEFPSRP